MAFDWEPYKSVLRRLYLVQGRTVPEIVSFMEVHHGVRRSPHQYEAVWHKWGFRKNVTAKTWKSVIRKIEEKLRKETRHDFASPLERYAVATVSPKTPEGFYVCTPGRDEGSPILVQNLPSICFHNYFLDMLIRFPAITQDGADQTISPSLIKFARGFSKGDSDTRSLSLFQMAGCKAVFGQQSSNVRLPSQLPELLCLIIFKMSNNKLRDDEADDLINLFLRLGGRQSLPHLLIANAPVVRALMRVVLEFAVRTNCLEIVDMLAKSGRDLNLPTGEWRETPLQIAVQMGDLETVRLLLEHGATPDLRLHNSDISLLLDVVQDQGTSYPPEEQLIERANQLDIVQQLIAAGADVNYNSWSDRRRALPSTALHAAIANSDFEIMDTLLKSGADVNVKDTYGGPALLLAVGTGDTRIVQRLIDHGADVLARARDLEREELDKYDEDDVDDADDATRYTAIEAAADQGHIDIVRLLLKHGACINPHIEGENGYNALQAAALRGHIDIVRLLIGHRMNAYLPPDDSVGPSDEWFGPEALQAACSRGNLDLVHLLINLGVYVDDAPPLQMAALKGHESIVRVLVSRRASVNAQPYEDKGHTALQAAALKGHYAIARFLIERGAEINAPPARNGGNTALQAAALGGHYDIARFLIERGAEINAPPARNGGNTALQAAALGGHYDIARFLIERGAEINAPPSRAGGGTALQVAARNGHISLVHLLVAHQAEVNDPPYWKEGYTALQAAAAGGHMDIVQFPIEHGASVDALPCHESGHTALQAAIYEGHDRILNLLVGSRADVNGPPCPVNGHTAVQAAAYKCRIDIVQLLVFCGADVNAPASALRGCTVLQAVMGGTGQIEARPALAELLIEEFGAEVNAVASRSSGMTPLQLAVNRGYKDTVRLLLRHGANVNACGFGIFGEETYAIRRAFREIEIDISRLLLNAGAAVGLLRSEDITPAAWPERVRLEMIQLLLGSGLNANMIVTDFWEHRLHCTLLQTMVHHQEREAVNLLLDREANVNAPACGKRGRTALQAAAANEDIDVVRILLDRGAGVDAAPAREYGVTALQAAAIEGGIETIILLLESGADVNAPAAEVEGRTALEGAAERGRLDAVQLLLNVGAEVEGTRAIALATEEGHDGVVALLENHQGTSR